MNTENKSVITICIIWIILNHILIFHVKSSTYKISGGQYIDIRDAKFVVQLIIEDSMCGGSLISRKYVVTAAHCVSDLNTTEILVVAGATYYDRGGVRSTVDHIHLPDFNVYSEFHWDIAVLKLHTALYGLNIDTIKLCRLQLYPGEYMTVYGWGMSSEFDLTFADVVYQKRQQLRDVEVPIWENRVCEDMLNYKMSDVILCAGVPYKKDACVGDSGGPAVFKNRLCGVVASGGVCPSIGVYVNVYQVKDFIKSVVDPNEEIE